MKKSMVSKICYGSGDIYGGGAFLVFSLLYMNFLILVEGLPVIAASTIILIGKVWDAVTDPIVGRLSDKTRSKYGRRRLYFLIGIVPVFLSFIILFYSFGLEGTTVKIIYHTLAYMNFGTAFTIVMVPYNTILSDITSDYNERTAFTTVRMVMSGAASLICAVVPGLIIKAVGGSVNGPEQKKGYLVMATVLAAIFGLCWLVVFLGTTEKKDLPEVEKTTVRVWLLLLENKPYRNFLGIFLTFQICVDLVLALFIFYVDIVVLKYGSYELIMGVLLVCQILFMIVYGGVAQKNGKAFPLFIGIPLWLLTSLLFAFVNSGTPVAVLIVFAVLIAAGASAGNLSTWSMLTDIFDLDEIQTSKRREGLYSGLTTFLRKFASGVAVFVLGIGLKAMGFDQTEYNLLKSSAVTDFDPSAYAQASIVSGIKWMFILIPFALLAVCLLFVTKNKINKKRFDAVLKGIECFKGGKGTSALSDEEVEDIETAVGKKVSELWKRL